MRTVRIKVYQFRELNTPAQFRAILNTARYIAEFIGPNSRFNKPANEVESGFLVGHLVKKYRTWILEEIETNKYEFTLDGKLA
jgi:hypothetical protein